MKVKDLFPLLGIGTGKGLTLDNCFFAKNAIGDPKARNATMAYFDERGEYFEAFQSIQGGKFEQMMKNREFVFVFLEVEKGYMLYRCYRKVKCISIKQAQKDKLIPQDYENEIGEIDKKSVYYEYEEIDTPGGLEERLVVEFCSGQVYCVKADTIGEYRVVEILPEKSSSVRFLGYMNVSLSYKELKDALEDDNWKYQLKKQNAIYIILDESDGSQYVGSSYGEKNGLYGRWLCYVKTLTGNDKELKKILNDKTKGSKHIKKYFRFSILETFTLKDKWNILKAESRWKKKLGTRAHGLNRSEAHRRRKK